MLQKKIYLMLVMFVSLTSNFLYTGIAPSCMGSNKNKDAMHTIYFGYRDLTLVSRSRFPTYAEIDKANFHNDFDDVWISRWHRSYNRSLLHAIQHPNSSIKSEIALWVLLGRLVEDNAVSMHVKYYAKVARISAERYLEGMQSFEGRK